MHFGVLVVCITISVFLLCMADLLLQKDGCVMMLSWVRLFNAEDFDSFRI